VRNYGFYLDLARYQGSPATNPAYVSISKTPATSGVTQAFPTKNALLNNTDPYFRGFDQANSDFYNYQEWASEFDTFVTNGNLPNLSLVRFPHDHFGSFSSALYGLNTPALQMSDNDYAVGLLVQKVAASPYAGNTLIFVIEDDAQDGPDHMDAHRSIAYVAGPYVKHGAVVSQRYNTVSMVRTMEVILGLSPSSLNSAAALPMTEVFDPFQKTWTYNALVPTLLRTSQLPLPQSQEGGAQPLERRPQPRGRGTASARDRHPASYWQKKLGGMDFSEEDKLDPARFNIELWKGIMGNKPYPTERSGKDLRENRKELLTKYGFE
jgi:DNA-binding beta-propeller fold protein YncE